MKDWCLIPTLDAVDYTEQAVADCLAQTGVDPAVLVVNNGGTTDTRQRLNQLQLTHPERCFVWHHDPPLPSLSATWNRMLQFVWAQGGASALVVNNDVRLDPWTYNGLLGVQAREQALFVSAVGWDERRWMDSMFNDRAAADPIREEPLHKGGPDFSCFLLTQSGHWQYPFDESFIPAYCEDLDTHRRYMLGGDGTRIFSVNLPYLHFASRTLNQSEAHRAAIGARIDQSRAYYKRKWGGDVNQERFLVPFGGPSGEMMTDMCEAEPYDVTTPTLQRMVQAGETFPWVGEPVTP